MTAVLAADLARTVQYGDPATAETFLGGLGRQALRDLVMALAAAVPVRPACCRNPACRKTLRPRPAPQRGYYGCQGYCGACYKRWQLTGFPESGPPAPRPSGGVSGAGFATLNAERAEQAAERAEDYAELRSWGVAPEDAARRIGVSAATGIHYERRWRKQEHQREDEAA